MDNVLVDFKSGVDATPEETLAKYQDDGTPKHKPHYDDIPGIFLRMKPMEGAVEAVQKLYKHFDCYILSTSPWGNATACSDKLEWIKKQFNNTIPETTLKPGETDCGNPFYKRVILTHHKDLCLQDGAWLIDDRDKHGADKFADHHIKFGAKEFPDWKSVTEFLLGQIQEGEE